MNSISGLSPRDKEGLKNSSVVNNSMYDNYVLYPSAKHSLYGGLLPNSPKGNSYYLLTFYIASNMANHSLM